MVLSILHNIIETISVENEKKTFQCSIPFDLFLFLISSPTSLREFATHRTPLGCGKPSHGGVPGKRSVVVYIVVVVVIFIVVFIVIVIVVVVVVAALALWSAG